MMVTTRDCGWAELNIKVLPLMRLEQTSLSIKPLSGSDGKFSQKGLMLIREP